jgi:hypothetical protein
VGSLIQGFEPNTDCTVGTVFPDGVVLELPLALLVAVSGLAAVGLAAVRVGFTVPEERSAASSLPAGFGVLAVPGVGAVLAALETPELDSASQACRLMPVIWLARTSPNGVSITAGFWAAAGWVWSAAGVELLTLLIMLFPFFGIGAAGLGYDPTRATS